MKRFIVTEDELKELYRAACSVGCGGDGSTDRAANAIEATRSRPVPEWATHMVSITDFGNHKEIDQEIEIPE